MYRSGSTLQYNIASEIIERLGVGSREKYYPIHEIYFKNKLNKSVESAPASASAAGTAGDIVVASDAIYVCVSTNTWKKAALSTF